MDVSQAKNLFALFIASQLVGCSIFSAPERTPYYPLLSQSTYSSDDDEVISTDNVLKSAIKHNDYVMVEETSDVNDSVEKVFAEAINSHSVSTQDLKSDPFHRGVELIIRQFTCELYASQQPDNSVQLCPQNNQIVDNGLGHLPFVDGVRFTERLSTIEQSGDQSLQLELFLKSTHERSLQSLWGAVHELGYFKGSNLPAESLVLTINLTAYKKDNGAHNWKYMYPDPLIFFIVLPPADLILSRSNEIESMNFAYRSAKLLVVDSR